MELLKPFANTGEKEDFSIDTSPDGLMSLEKGFTQLFELKPEEGGLFILRKKFNQLMYLMSKANVEFNTQSFPNWIADKGDGSPYSYKKGVIVTYTDNMQYVSLINNNTEEPTKGSNWKLADLNNYMDLLTNQDVDGVKTFTSFPITPSSTPSTDYQVANKKYVDKKIVANGLGAGADLNNLKLNGFYWTGTTTNQPSNEFGKATILIIGNNTVSTAITQIYTNIATGNIYKRNFDGASWSIWGKINNEGLGQGQTWQDVTASRSSGVTYTNTTGKPIYVKIAAENTTINLASTVSYTISNITFTEAKASKGSLDLYGIHIDFIVPNGSTYSFTNITNSRVGVWAELR